VWHGTRVDITVSSPYLCTMPRFAKVRLGDEHARKLRALQAAGIRLSEIVRVAIDRRYDALQARAVEDPEAMIRRIHEMYPDPPDTPPRGYDVHD